MAKSKQFTTTDPLVIVICKVGGHWDIQASATTPAAFEPAKTHFEKMKDRLKENLGGGNTLRDELRGFYVGRRKAPFAPPLPPCINPLNPNDQSDIPHVPIMMREGETVIFRCDPPYEFKIWCDRDDNVDPNLSAPANPFGWTTAQIVAPGGSLMATVQTPSVDSRGNPTGPGPKDQGFYKFSASVYVEATGGNPPEIARPDPDGYCDR